MTDKNVGTVRQESTPFEPPVRILIVRRRIHEKIKQSSTKNCHTGEFVRRVSRVLASTTSRGSAGRRVSPRLFGPVTGAIAIACIEAPLTEALPSRPPGSPDATPVLVGTGGSKQVQVENGCCITELPHQPGMILPGCGVLLETGGVLTHNKTCF